MMVRTYSNTSIYPEYPSGYVFFTDGTKVGYTPLVEWMDVWHVRGETTGPTHIATARKYLITKRILRGNKRPYTYRARKSRTSLTDRGQAAYGAKA